MQPERAQPTAVLGGRTSESQNWPGRGTSGFARALLLAGLLLALILAARWLSLGAHIAGLRVWINRFGFFGPFAFTLLYALGTVFAIPGSAMTVTAAALFGSAVGIVVVSIGATLGASLAFLAARYIAREAVAQWLSRYKWFDKLDALTRERGAWAVALTRFIPLFPFNLLNYAFGLTRVPFWTYVFWSWLCMLPGVVLYVVGFDAIVQVTRGRVAWRLIGLVAVTGIALTLIIRRARRTLQKANSR